jgi:Ni/Co efflux regulator RcnB
MRNLILAVIAAGFAAGTAVAADDGAPAAPPQADSPAPQANSPAPQAPPAGWHGDHWEYMAEGPGMHHFDGPPPGEGWRSEGDGHWHRYGEWHSGGPGEWHGATHVWRGQGGWPGGYVGHGDYAYRRFSRGGTVPPLWRDDRFYVRDWFAFGLTEPAYGYRWIRYYNDALLIGVSNGQVYDVVPDVDWGRAYGAPVGYGAGYGYGPRWGWSGWSYGYVMPASVIVTTPETTTTVTEDDYVAYRAVKHRRAIHYHLARRCSCK